MVSGAGEIKLCCGGAIGEADITVRSERRRSEERAVNNMVRGILASQEFFRVHPGENGESEVFYVNEARHLRIRCTHPVSYMPWHLRRTSIS